MYEEPSKSEIKKSEITTRNHDQQVTKSEQKSRREMNVIHEIRNHISEELTCRCRRRMVAAPEKKRGAAEDGTSRIWRNQLKGDGGYRILGQRRRWNARGNQGTNYSRHYFFTDSGWWKAWTESDMWTESDLILCFIKQPDFGPSPQSVGLDSVCDISNSP